MTTDRHACGLSSFLPMSCRGRAEAFARRLQSRLQSLGRQPSDDPNDTEESWLTSSQHFPTAATNHQPAARLSSSSDSSDVYFDFDVYFGSPGSPLEEATEDDVVVNRPRDYDAASSSAATAMAASPGSDDSTYFDPEGFDFGKPSLDADLDAQCNGHDAVLGACCSAEAPLGDGADVYYPAPQSQTNEPGESSTPVTSPPHETLNTTDCPADVTDNAGHSCARVRKPRVDYTKCNGIRHKHSAETHEAETNTHEAQVGRLMESHEAEVEHTTKTHELDTETHEVKTKACEAEVEHSAETHERETESNEAETRVHEEVEIAHSTETHEAETSTHEAEHATEPHEAESDTHDEPVYTSVATLSDGENLFCSTLNVSTHELLVVECPTSSVPDVEVTTAPEPTAPKEAATTPRAPAREEGVAKKQLEVIDDIDYEERPQRVRRCSSLKTGKTPPGTPGRKKIVRFADVLGLDLADVRTFLDEVPKVPTSAYEDLVDADLSATLTNLAAAIGGSLPKPDKTLVPMFAQPGGCADFFDRVREQQVCLENAIVSDVMLATIAGTVRVRNLDFNKSVHIRYSVDGWKTFSDLQASYVQNSCDGFSDTFSFVLYAHTVTVGQRLEFAVRFQCHGCQYWDSNKGANYAFQCLPPTGQMSFRSHPMSTCPDEQWASFY